MEQITKAILEMTGILVTAEEVRGELAWADCVSEPKLSKDGFALRYTNDRDMKIRHPLPMIAESIRTRELVDMVANVYLEDREKVADFICSEMSVDERMNRYRTDLNPANPNFDNNLEVFAQYLADCIEKYDKAIQRIKDLRALLKDALESESYTVVTEVAEDLTGVIVHTYNAL